MVENKGLEARDDDELGVGSCSILSLILRANENYIIPSLFL